MHKIKNFFKRVDFWWYFIVKGKCSYFDCKGFCPFCKFFECCYDEDGVRW